MAILLIRCRRYGACSSVRVGYCGKVLRPAKRWRTGNISRTHRKSPRNRPKAGCRSRGTHGAQFPTDAATSVRISFGLSLLLTFSVFTGDACYTVSVPNMRVSISVPPRNMAAPEYRHYSPTLPWIYACLITPPAAYAASVTSKLR